MKISVEIIKEIKKAKLVRDGEGREAWVQNRSFKDGEVNETTFLKGVDWLARKTEEKVEAKAFDNGHSDISEFIEGTTNSGKAEYLTLDLWEEATDQNVRKRVFLPISMKTDEGYPNWILVKKAEEIRQELSGKGFFVNESNVPVLGCDF